MGREQGVFRVLDPVLVYWKALPAAGRRHSVLQAILLDDDHELLVQRIAAVSARGGILRAGLFELVYPRFAWLVQPPSPAKLLESVGQFTAFVACDRLVGAFMVGYVC